MNISARPVTPPLILFYSTRYEVVIEEIFIAASVKVYNWI